MSSLAHQEKLMQVILGAHVSEKTSAVADSAHQIVFKVRRDATKKDIKAAVEMLFEGEVSGVTVVCVPGKAKRFGTVQGRRSTWKKAYVRLAPGHDIDFVGAE